VLIWFNASRIWHTRERCPNVARQRAEESGLLRARGAARGRVAGRL